MDSPVTLPIAADLGNHTLKAISMRVNDPDHVIDRHALIELSRDDFMSVMDFKAYNPDAYAIVNGRYYVMGQSAEDGYLNRLTEHGTERWTPEHAGALMAIMAKRLYPQVRNAKLVLMMTYPPGHFGRRDKLLNAVNQTFRIRMYHDITNEYDSTFDVVAVRATSEANGGLSNLALDWGGSIMDNALISGRNLVIDVGGGTTDVQGFGRNGELLPDYRQSLGTGIEHVLRAFTNACHASWREFPDSPLPSKLRSALVTGWWGNQDLTEESNKALIPFVNSLVTTISGVAGSLLNWDNIILTGGGGYIVHKYLQEALGDNYPILLATGYPDDEDAMVMANVIGAAKLFQYWNKHDGTTTKR